MVPIALVETRFVGRAAELAELTARLDAALAGEPGVVLLGGEPGIGKTRLATELGRLAGNRAVPVLWGGCSPEPGAPAFWPWRRVLREWRARGGDVPADLAPVDSGPLPTDPGPADRFALFDAAARFLSAAAADTGLVVVLDDVQWADPASVALLAHVAREPGPARLLVVGTYRSAELRVPLVEVPGRRLELRGLDAAAVAELAGGDGAALRDRTGGNPFFLHALLDDRAAASYAVSADPRRGDSAPSALEADPRHPAPAALEADPHRPAPAALDADPHRPTPATLDADPHHPTSAALDADPHRPTVPGSVRDVVARRVGRLPEECRAQLGRIAVIGPECEVALLVRLGCADPASALRPALTDGLLERVGGRVRFSHDLVREALLADLPDRAAQHLAVVEVLAPRASDPDVLPELARHALAALPLGDRARTLGWAREAGELALRSLAYEEAARLFGTVLDERAEHPAERLALLLRTAEVLGWSHAVHAASDRAAEAAELARMLGDPAGLGRAALVLPGVSDVDWMLRSGPWAAEALDLLPADDSPLRARLLAHHAHMASMTGDQPLTERLSLEALAIADRLDDRRALVDALRARQLARSGPDGNAERLELGTRMVSLAARTHDPEDALWGRLWRFDALLQAGEVRAATDELALLSPLVGRLRRPVAELHLLRCRVALLFGEGRFEEATALNTQAHELGLRGGHEGARLVATAVRYVIGMLTGDAQLDRAQVEVMARASIAPQAALMQTTIANLALAEGDRAAALRWYRMLPPTGSPRILAFFALSLECTRALLAAELGDRIGAEACYRWLRPYVDLMFTGGAGAVSNGGSVHLHAGVAALAAGRPEAVRHLRRAIEVNAAAGLVPFEATAQVWLAEELRRRGDTAEADRLADAALRTARTLGMKPLAARIEAASPGPLSRREAEIAELVGRGLTNRQIAADRHISERTVETHVAHIMAKLGVSGRSGIAAWEARRRR